VATITLSDALDLLMQIEKAVDEADTDIAALASLDRLAQNDSNFYCEIRHNQNHSRVAAWLRALHKIPSVYMYQYHPSYDKFLEYKYWMRRGQKSDDLPELLDKLEVDQHRTAATGVNGEFEQNIPFSLKLEAEYD
jgi:hypothetical protein